MLIIFFQILHKGKDLFEILSLLRIFWGDLKVLLFGNLTKQFLIGVKYPAFSDFVIRLFALRHSFFHGFPQTSCCSENRE